MATKENKTDNPVDAEVLQHVERIKYAFIQVGNLELTMGEEYHAISILKGSTFTAWMKRQDKLTGVSESTAWRYLKDWRKSVVLVGKEEVDRMKETSDKSELPSVRQFNLTASKPENAEKLRLAKSTGDKEKLHLVTEAIAKEAKKLRIRKPVPKSLDDRLKSVSDAVNRIVGEVLSDTEEKTEVRQVYAVSLGVCFQGLAEKYNLSQYGVSVNVTPKLAVRKSA